MPDRDPYENSAVEQYAGQLSNPAAPAGLHQTVKAAKGYSTQADEYASTQVGKYAAEQGYTSVAPSWFTGANTEGTNNGWSTDFTEKFIAGQDKAAAEGTLSKYFSQPDATGVVTWDHKSEDGRDFHFGDVYVDGQKVANLFDENDGGFDRDTANLMMAAWVLDGTQQARVFSDSDRMGALDREIKNVHLENNENIPKAQQAAEFAAKTQDTAERFTEGHVDEALVGGGAVGGAVTGAGTGALLTAWAGPGAGVGAVVGGVLGGIAGGVGALLNKDELTQQAARAYEITKLADREEGTLAGVLTGLQQFSGLSTQLSSPVTNLSHGLVELTGDNKIGDSESAYYGTDKHGDNTRPAWAKPLSLASNLVDGVLQFASPVARALYTAQIGTQIAGEVGTLAATGGKLFDPREGGFDNIFVDDDGNFDPVSASAGLMKIGIDAVQLGGLRGLARATGVSRAEVQAGVKETEVAGYRFTFDETGKAIGKKRTFALLAPSEQVAAASAARKARVAAMLEGRAATADDFYKAATSLATGSNRVKRALVNGFGEGYEEAVQSLLEPIAMDGRVNPGEVIDSFLAGAAMGTGFSLGATAGAPTQDARLKNQAFALETYRRGGEEPDAAEFDAMWSSASDAQKRVLASRSESDVKAVRQALDRISQEQAATIVATEVDAAKALDARRTAVEAGLRSDTDRTDAYHVMSGQLSAPVSRPEAVEASALTIARLLEDRTRGLALQAQTLATRITDPDDPLQAEDATLLRQVELARAVGANLTGDVLGLVDRIYDEDTTEEQAAEYVDQLNALLEGLFEERLDVRPPEGYEGEIGMELRRAAAKFVTLLHSREPKLDSGSYLALLPRVSWELTRTDSDNLLQVNTDMLASINGDFDGDKLRSEYQLVLSDERFAQARAGQLLGGRGRTVDVVARNFDLALTRAVATSAVGEDAQLRDEANATLAKIESEISARYGSLMSPAALDRVFTDFRTAVFASEDDTAEEARVTLLNSLAREAGEAVTDLGRRELRNEWLWASKIVRENFEEFQRTYRVVRAAGAAPSETAPVADLDTPEGTNARKAAAVSTAQTLAVFAVGNSLFRKFQKIHYTFYNSSVLSAAGAERADLYEMARLYEELSRGITRPELERVTGTDQIGARVLAMLARLVDDARTDPALADLNFAEAMTVLANVRVKDVEFRAGEPVLVDGADISLVQLLLKRALDADREEHRATFDTDEKLQAKHARLRSMTFPNRDGEVNAERAFLEVFGATPFGESLGRVTGAIAPHTTPEQWLRNYISLDAEGRRSLERLFTNVPEYLDRKESQNLPYSMDEARRREVTPYRSMLDALMAVGRTELTFDPAKKPAEAFGGRRAEVSQRAAADFIDGHTAVTKALDEYRKIANRSTKDRASRIALVQEMFESNPSFARTALDLIPNASANAVFESRDGELYVARWVYEMFTIDDPKQALFFYWKNLTLAQWNATLAGGLEGRKYAKLNSRFQRLLYQLSREPGQLHLELVLRKMDTAKDLDEFFHWLNATPGIRSNQAPLLPFNDDVAEFEADAAGGWVTSRASSDLRAAITAMRTAAVQLRTTLEFRQEKAATDKILRDGIRRARNGEPDGDYEALRKLERAVQISQELPRGFAPTAMLALTSGAMRGFDAHSHDKGVTADSYKPLGEFQALMDAFAFVPGLERTMEVLTAHSIGSLTGNVGDLAKHPGTAMDAHGRQIEWARLTVDEALDMLDDPRTEPLALALLTPQALDLANGKLTERVLTEASLKDLLDNRHYADLFNLDGDNALNNAMRYLMVVDSRARAEGGHFDVIRYVNALAITRMSALGRESTEDDRARIRNQAYLDTARALQLVGQVQATPELRDNDTLAELRKAAVQVLREANAARRLPGFTEAETGVVVEGWVQQMLADLDAEQLRLHTEAAERFTGEELAHQLAVIDAQYEANTERIRAVLEDDLAAAVATRFRLTGDPARDAAARAAIVDYAMSTTAAGRMPESIEIWSKLAAQREDGRTPELSITEWEQLSRSVMGVYLADQLVRVASHVSIPAFGKGDPAVTEARFFKYLDPAYAFIATDLLTEDSPMAAAAAWLHTTAEQPRGLLSVDSMTSTLKRTILNDQQLGPWTPAQMSQIVETQERMDSAPVAGGVAAAGNGPKRWAAIAYATRRNAKKVPGPDLLTTVSIPADLLAEGADPFNEVEVIPAGHTEPTGMPIAQLDNRYMAAVRINGQEIPLDTENLGFAWAGEVTPTGYRYVSLERLRPVVERIGGPGATVEIDFFHPDSRPAGEEWLHNVYFDGMEGSLLPDGSESLIAAFWSANGGRIAEDTQRPLDAGKKGLPAIERFVRPDAAALAAAEEHWNVGTDMAAMLRAKTELLLAADDSVDSSDYNALYKMLGLQHLVVGTLEGRPAAWTAEQVIAHAAANGKSAPLPLEGARLVKLSPDVLRTMLGDTGDQGVGRFFDEEYLLNPDQVAEYTGVTDAMVNRFPGWFAETGKPGDTALANVGMQRVLRVRTVLTDAERNARQERIEFLDSHAAQVRAARYAKLKGTDARDGYLAVLKLAVGSVSVERNTFDFQSAGIPIAPRNVGEATHTMRLLESLKGVVDRNDYQRGWRVVDGGETSFTGGQLTVESLDDDRPLEHRIVKDDIVLVELASFERPERDITQVHDRVEKTLRYLVNTGATIVLGSGNGGGDLRDFADRYLRDHGYPAVAGSRHLHAPAEFQLQTQNERSYESTLTETRRIRPARTAVTFLTTDPIGTDENAAVLNPASRKLRDRKLLNNLLPSSTFPHFNLPLDDGLDNGLYARTLAHLRSVTDPASEHRAELLAMGGADPARLMTLSQALDRFHDRITNRASLAPEVGDTLEVGDIVPFVHPDGKVILYRHGFKLPKPEDLQGLFDNAASRVVLAASETEPAATANSGVVREIDARAGYGRTLLLETPLQPYGDKVQLEWNGMKYVVVPPSADLSGYLAAPVFANGTVVDLVSDYASAKSKEAYEGLVLNYRNALAFFQFDFTDDLVRFFYPDEATRPPQAAVLVYSMLSKLASTSEYKIPLPEASVLAHANIAVADTLSQFAATLEESGGPAAEWIERLGTGADATAGIARAVITYLMTHDAHLDNVLKSAGFSHSQAANDVVTTRVVPGLFADLLDQGLDSPVHAELISRFDAQLARTAAGAGYKLHPDWTVEVFDGRGGSLRGYLQFGEVHSSGDNPLLDGQAYDSTEPGSVSAHNAMAAALSLGAITAYKGLRKATAFAKSFSRGGDVVKPGNDGESVWKMLTALPDEKDRALAGWRRETPAETLRRALARTEIVGFYTPLTDDGWTPEQRAEYQAVAEDVLRALNLYGSQRAMVDTWVRMHLGRPAGIDEDGHELGVIKGSDAVEIAKKIKQNVTKHLLPTAGANVPLIDVNHLTTIYLANLNRDDGREWAPRTSLVQNAAKASTWDAWVDVAFGTAWIMGEDTTSPVPEPDFHQMFTLAVDGLMHGYQDATTATRYLPVASDILRQRQLMDPETNRMLVSIDADENLLATDPTLFNATAATLDEIVGGQRIYAPGRKGPDPSSAMGEQAKRFDRWHREVDAPRQRNKKMRGVRQPGSVFLSRTTKTSAFWRSIINLRVGNVLFNPLLIISAPVEAFQRRTIDKLADLAVGESTGKLGRAQVRLAERFADGKIGTVASELGLTPTYSSEQLDRLDDLVAAISTNPEFKALVFKELMHQYPAMPGIGRVEKWLEKYAKFGARIQDPTWGMLPKDLARIYVKTAMRRISADPTGENIYSVERLITGLSRNAEWLEQQDRETHNMAIAAIANIRSLKPNVISLMTRNIIEPLAEHDKFVVNSIGNMLKLLTTFQNFWSNSIINVTGMQGVADFAAFHLDGRKKSKLVRRFQAGIAGEPFVPGEDEHYDMSEVLEGLDLADSFIRGGITHTALFTLGAAFGSLGLTGEDDEERWRRRAAELQGAGFVHDPREAANDFRNKGAIFLDWLPLGLDSLFRVNPADPDSDSLAQMNWTMRYFMSPILGFERFYQTGDFTEILHGFGDAVGSHPVVNTALWNEATATASELHAAANDAVEKGDDEQGAHLLVTAVGVMERMLLENSMLNMIYVGTDRYDRDPYKLPARNETGELLSDVRGNPYQTNTALTPMVDDNGTPDDPSDDFVRETYVDRDPAGALFRSFTENRFGLAFLGSLYDGVTGGSFTGSDFFRKNMPVKTRKIELAPQDQGELEAYLLAAFQGAGGQRGLSETEAAQIIKNKVQAAGGRWDAAEVEKLAAEWSAHSGMAEMSRIDEAGREHLTDAGARAVFDGLRKGALTLGTAPLNGVYMTREQRDKIRDTLVKEITQEGVDLGLTKDQALWRTRRIVFGTGTEAETANLIDLLYTDQIPYSDTLEYNQLNTTYVTGPTGFPMATGFTRDGLLGAFGLKPLLRPIRPEDSGLDVDGRMNAVDGVAGINTGLRGLEPRPQSWEIPTVQDAIHDAAEKVIDALKDLDFGGSDYKPASYGGRGYGGYGRRGRGGYSGGGGGGYYSNPYKLYALPGLRVPFGNAIPFINTSNPIIRRADVRRERVWSERGRLNQWQ